MSLNFKGSPLNVKYYGCIIEVFYASFLVVYERGGGGEIQIFEWRLKHLHAT